MKKLLISIFAVVCIVCLCCGVACANGKYYMLTNANSDMQGIKYIFLNEENGETLNFGMEVKAGYTVNFKVEIDKDKVKGDNPVVKANENALEANDEGVYSFVMNSNTELKVDGVEAIDIFELRLPDHDYYHFTTDAGEYEIETDSKGNRYAVYKVTSGTEVNFTINVSSYYKPEYELVSNTVVIDPMPNSRPETDPEYEDYKLNYKNDYKLTVKSKTTVMVNKLEQEESFFDKPDGGDGTRANPYKISKPIDLFTMSALINDSRNTLPAIAYYVLTNDINMRGEKLYVIGENYRINSEEEQNTFFAGDFEGNNHTIYNFYMDNEKIEQSGFTTVYLTSLGLFGSATATNKTTANIRNLHLRDFDVNFNATSVNAANAVGTIVGVGNGAYVSNCSATNGRITVTGNANYPTVAGGIIGSQQSVYSNDGVVYPSVVSSCRSDVEINGTGVGVFYTAGGISGILSSDRQGATTAVINSYSTGDISGAINAGGIAGMVGAYASIGNSYSTGTIIANTTFSVQTAPAFAYSNAGGIAGVLDNDSIIYNCYSVGESLATAIGDRARYGGIVGYKTPVGESYADGYAADVRNCYSAQDDSVTINHDFVRNTLGWGNEWQLGEEHPQLTGKIQPDRFKIELWYGTNYVDGVANKKYDSISSYAPLSVYFLTEGKFTEYIDSDISGTRSYGFYFDSALTEKVSEAFIPTGDVTLYVGFADYSEVAGVYNIVNGNGAYIELLSTGELTYRFGAISYPSHYSYDGRDIRLYNTMLAIHSANINSTQLSQYYYYNYMATVSGGSITVTDNTVFPENKPLTAVVENASFEYGRYKAVDTDGRVFTFNKDGTGTVTGGTVNNTFTFKITGNSVNIVYSNNTSLTATLSGGVITKIGSTNVVKLDKFEGTWEISALVGKNYTFDGVKNWTSSDNSAGGTYTVSGNVLTMSNGTTVTYSQDGVSVIVNKDGKNQTYYRQYSFKGVWKFNNASKPIEISFNGINENGYGTADVEYGGEVAISEIANYQVAIEKEDIVVYVYLDDMCLAKLRYVPESRTLETVVVKYVEGYDDIIDYGNSDVLYSAADGAYFTGVVKMFMYDSITGVWVTPQSGLEFIEFNGQGNYVINGNTSMVSVRGYVTINGIKYAYEYDENTAQGKFTVNKVEYTFTFDENNNSITVSVAGGGSFVAGKADEWYGYNLIDDDGAIYEFDGRGNLSGNSGKLTVTAANGTQTVYTYTNTGSGSVSLSGAATGTITKNTVDNCFTLSIGNKKLYVYSGAVGEWYISGSLDSITIGKIGADNTATGTYRGENKTFTYDKEKRVLSFDVNGVKLYAYEVGGTVLISSLPNGVSGAVLCIKTTDSTGGDVLDEYRGKHVYNGTEEDDDYGSYFILDGFGGSGYRGTALLYTRYDEFKESYTYDCGEYGPIFYNANNKAVFIFVENDKGYTLNNVTRAPIKIDVLYNREVTDTSGNTYVFNGLGDKHVGVLKVVNGSNTLIYSYTIDKIDYVEYLIEIALTDSIGKTEKIVVDVSNGSDIKVVDALKNVTATYQENLKYTFNGKGTVTKSGSNIVAVTYKYTIVDVSVSLDKQITYNLKLVYTDEDNKEHNSLLTLVFDAAGNARVISHSDVA